LTEIETNDEFSLAGYHRIIEGFVEQGYNITDYPQIIPQKRHLILRHDVDFDLQRALEMAEFESKCGWRATYFILLRTEFYNLFSSSGSEAVNRILQLGHQIGLHFDATYYPPNPILLAEAVKSEAAILSNIMDSDISRFSFHRPHPELLEKNFEVEGFLNAYDDRFRTETSYCSDSRGGWHYGHPLDHECLEMGGAMQLLTHPIWWTEAGATPQEKCSNLLDHRFDLLEQEAEMNCKSFVSRRQK
jgi:hypothetical protein